MVEDSVAKWVDSSTGPDWDTRGISGPRRRRDEVTNTTIDLKSVD